MIPRQLDIDLKFGTFSVSGALSLASITSALNQLRSINDESRSFEETPPYLRIRVRCPSCHAPFFQLTAYDRDGELLRACRCCRTEFSVEV